MTRYPSYSKRVPCGFADSQTDDSTGTRIGPTALCHESLSTSQP